LAGFPLQELQDTVVTTLPVQDHADTVRLHMDEDLQLHDPPLTGCGPRLTVDPLAADVAGSRGPEVRRPQ